MDFIEFDPSPRAIINPEEKHPPIPNCPKTVITCFPCNLIEYVLDRYGGEEIAWCKGANGVTPLYRTQFHDVPLGLMMLRVGAPMAAMQLEDLFAWGAEQVVVFGTCGVMNSCIGDCAIILPDRAIREEGTSYHYMPPSREIDANVGTLDLMQRFFTERKVPHITGKVWSTDAFFRETPGKVACYRSEGCLAAEMECSALTAVAQFRGKQVAHFLYAADNLDSAVWDMRSLSNEANLNSKFALMELALEFGILWEKHLL